MQQIFEGVFRQGKRIFTRNLVPGERVYGEELASENCIEYRGWNPYRSKLAAAIMNGLKELPIKKGDSILYLGSAEGTTPSHLSDIIASEGLLFGVDVSARVMPKFVSICEKRPNMLPILADANSPESFAENIDGSIDVLYQDVAQKNQPEIFQKNSDAFLKNGGFGFLVVKAKSMDVRKGAKEALEQTLIELKGFTMIQAVFLDPFEKDHALVLCKKNWGKKDGGT